jgi:hypothetical protein
VENEHEGQPEVLIEVFAAGSLIAAVAFFLGTETGQEDVIVSAIDDPTSAAAVGEYLAAAVQGLQQDGWQTTLEDVLGRLAEMPGRGELPF